MGCNGVMFTKENKDFFSKKREQSYQNLFDFFDKFLRHSCHFWHKIPLIVLH